MLYRLMVARSLSHSKQWILELTLLDLPDNQESWDCLDLDSFTNFTEIASSRISWVCPYSNPFDHSSHPNLPFSHSWSDEYLNIVFGVCEVYVCRIQLTPRAMSNGIPESCPLTGLQCDNEDITTSSVGAGVDTEGDCNIPSTQQTPPRLVLPVSTPKFNQPIFLPVSTVIRQFSFPTITISRKEYVLFALAGSTDLDLPPVLIFRDVEEDLGGWVANGAEESEEVTEGVRIGRGAEGNAGDEEEESEES